VLTCFNSRQIRPPIYSLKQSKLRKRRVWRYAVLYFVLLVVFIALLVGPIVAGSKILSPSLEKKIPLSLFQPVGLNNNDTQNYTETGTGTLSGAGSTAAATNKVRLF
jgi:1,3-beta-glucan synthase